MIASIALLTSIAGAALAGTIPQTFNLQLRGYDPAINNSYLVPTDKGNGVHYALSASAPESGFSIYNGELYYPNGDDDPFKGYYTTTANGVQVIALGFTDSYINTFGFDGEGRLSIDNNQWGFYACKDLGDPVDQDSHGVGFWADPGQVDQSRCTPITLQRLDIVPV